jgi:hypothetical protein
MSDNAHKVGRRARTTKPDLWYYDRLPPTARRALAEAERDWASSWLYTRWKSGAPGFKTGKDCAAKIAWADRSAAKRNAPAR